MIEHFKLKCVKEYRTTVVFGRKKSQLRERNNYVRDEVVASCGEHIAILMDSLFAMECTRIVTVKMNEIYVQVYTEHAWEENETKIDKVIVGWIESL